MFTPSWTYRNKDVNNVSILPERDTKEQPNTEPSHNCQGTDSDIPSHPIDKLPNYVKNKEGYRKDDTEALDSMLFINILNKIS